MKSFIFSNHRAKKFLIILIAIEVFFVIMYSVDVMFDHQNWIIHNIFDLDKDISLPALFSSIQLFSAGIVLYMIAQKSKQQSPPSSTFFALLAAGFIYLSIDEGIRIHENITALLKHIEWMPRFKGDHGIWIPVYFSIALMFLLIEYKEFLAIWKHYRSEALVIVKGLTIYLLGVVGMEVIAYQCILDGSNTPLLLYYIEVAAEEFLEMMGISIVLYGIVLLYDVRNVKASRD